jgi:type VI secretion system secreted protein Hcp
MAANIFLKLGPIKGEATQDGHKDEISVLSWHFAESQEGSGHTTGGAGTGKVHVQDLNFTHYIDSATPDMYKYCAAGTQINQPVVLTVLKADGEVGLKYMEITLEDVMVSHISTGGSDGEALVTESVGLHFNKFKVKYTIQTDNGSKGKDTQMGWDIKLNKEYS